MYRRHLIVAAAIMLVISSVAFAQIDKIGIFNERVGWTTTDVAKAVTEEILANVKAANEIVVLNDADIGAFATANTKDGNFDIIILFGDFASSLYTPGNAQADGSVGELFLEGGDMFFNTADYIFYVNNGAGANGDTGLKNMTDSNLDLWTDGNTSIPTAAGKSYAPSMPDSFNAPRAFRLDQVEADPDWELEIAFASNADGTTADPVIIRNKTYGGRIGIAFQVSDDTMPRGAVMSEIIQNYLAANTTAVKPAEKITTTWGSVKNFQLY